MSIFCIESFCPQKTQDKRCSSIIYPSSTVAIFTTDTSLWTCAFASANWTVVKAGLSCYLVIHIGNHYRCFTSIFDMYTDSSSHIYQQSHPEHFTRKMWWIFLLSHHNLSVEKRGVVIIAWRNSIFLCYDLVTTVLGTGTSRWVCFHSGSDAVNLPLLG
jgi:hypothetical protein